MLCYEVIAGSRSYGLELPSSDIDICRVSNTCGMALDGKNNFIQVSKQEFIERVIGKKANAYYYQWLYPAKALSEGPLIDWVIANRERVISAQGTLARDILMGHAENLEYFADMIYAIYPKRLAYATLLYHIAARYGEKCFFEQAHKPEPYMKSILLGMRKNEVPLEDALAVCAEQKKRAISVMDRYKDPDPSDLKAIKNELQSLLSMV